MKNKKEDYIFDDINENDDDMINLLDKYDSIEENQENIFKKDESIENNNDNLLTEKLTSKKRKKKKEKYIETKDLETNIDTNTNENISTELNHEELDDIENNIVENIDEEKTNDYAKKENVDITVEIEDNDKVEIEEKSNEEINNLNNDFLETEEKTNSTKEKEDFVTEEPISFKQDKLEKKSEIPEIFISLTGFAAVGYYIYYVFQSLNEINYTLKITNATLLLATLLFAISAFINKNKTKKRDFMIICVSIILVSFLGLNLGVNTNIIKLPTLAVLRDYTNTSLVNLLKWADDNEIELKQEYEYSDNIKEGYIISQSIKPDTIVKKIKTLKVVVSSGPNYDKELVLSDFVGLKVDELIKFIKKNHMNNANINFSVNDIIEKDTIISQSTKGEIKRNTQVNFNVSLGKAIDLPEINIENLVNKSLFEATLYLKRNGIKYNITYEYSSKIKKDFIIKQDIKAKTKVKPGVDTLNLVVSNGKEIKVPDFAGKTSEDVVNWIIKNNLRVEFQEKYHVSIKKGGLIGINYQPGISICEGTKIIVTTSLGPIIVPSFTSLAELRNWATNNNVTVSESYEYSKDVAKGNIIKVNFKKGDKMDPAKDSLAVQISQGSPISVPYFVGKSKGAIQTQCRNIGLNCTFYYVGYNNAPADTAVNQNVNSGLQVVSGTYVNIGLSSGAPQTFTVFIQSEWFESSASSTIATLSRMLKAQAPGVGFNFYTQSSNSGFSGQIHPNSPIKGGQNTFKQGVTYNIIIIA